MADILLDAGAHDNTVSTGYHGITEVQKYLSLPQRSICDGGRDCGGYKCVLGCWGMEATHTITGLHWS